MQITPKSLTMTQLFSSESEQYVVPAYQRRYSWHEKQLVELLDDVSLLEGSDTHLLGSIVCLTGHHTAGINKLELVDGQQRLTSVCILLRCIADRLIKEGEVSAAQDVERFLQAKALGGPTVHKVLLDSLDSGEFEQHLAGHTLDRAVNQNLSRAFSIFREWVGEKKLTELGTFLYRLKNQCIVIRLEVSDAKDAFKLFETINNRGLRLQLNRHHKKLPLGKCGSIRRSALSMARQKWAKLIEHLDNVSFESFFRHFLCASLKRRVTRAFVIAYFKKLFMHQVVEAKDLPERHWYLDEKEVDAESDQDIDGGDESDSELDAEPEIEVQGKQISFAAFMDDLVTNAKVYGHIVRGDTGNVKIDRRLRNLRMIKSAQTYGFLMYLRNGGCSDADYLKILRMTESFMMRRHICKQRTNENDTAFARLCGIDCQNPTTEVKKVFREFSPPDEKFKEDFAETRFGGGLLERARYCLEQIELHRQGSNLELLVAGPEEVHVEHIIPQKIKTKKAKEEYGDWPTYLGQNSELRHPKLVSRIGNLTLFAGPLNISASNNPYKRKKTAYLESAIKITNSLPEEFPEFKFAQIENRSGQFAELAVELWPIA